MFLGLRLSSICRMVLRETGTYDTMIFYLLLKLRENVQNVKFLLLRWFKVLKEKKRIILCI
jgi:hypothetical protein